MAADVEPQEADRVEGAPHPRLTTRIYGQEVARAAWDGATAGGRRHHAWLITGPRGVGKATLAWALARETLAEGVPPGQMAALDQRIAALSEARLLLLRRAWDAKAERLKTVIDVEETRRLKGFLQLSAADGGWRVVIVDAAEEMNASAANALLKLLEEPPARVLFLLVSHQPARLLPTIRSRCRALRCAALSPADLDRALAGAGAAAGDAAALAELSGGSAGEALRLLAEGGAEVHAGLVRLLADLPRLDRPEVLALCDSVGGRDGAGRFDLALRLMSLVLARLARTGATGQTPPEAAPGEAALLRRLAPDAAAARIWAATAQTVAERGTRARAVNLDPGDILFDLLMTIEAAATSRSPG